MQIRRLHVSGFKSFADSLDIEFRHRLTGIVGPNGCGKSNLFEAVRWVMGESSSRNLRAESGADVICNGSGSRKAASRAEVELVFDNSDGRIGGKAGAWAEISVRRSIDRDSESRYYLNGTRCRKRDITALFSGTGFGPRGYSIIEQGMISRIIEARPDELRGHLEEAAGVSSYRTSRRETESRMRATRSNLQSVVLLETEVERQMKSLRRQAQQAGIYHELSAREKQLQAWIMALSWQHYGNQNTELQQQNSSLVTELEKERGQSQAVATEMEKLRFRLQGMEQESDELQHAFYELSTTVSVQEKECQHNEQKLARLQQERQALAQRMEQEQQQLAQDDQQVQQLEQETAQLNASLLKLRENATAADNSYTLAEQGFEQCQQQLATGREQLSELQREHHSSETRLEALQQLLQQSIKRREEIEAEIKLGEDDGHDDELEARRDELQQLRQNCDQLKESVTRQVEKLQDLRNQATTVDSNLSVAREKLRQLHGELSSLKALQNESLKSNVDATVLRDNGLDQVPRLGERLQANASWHLAVETVLNKHLQDLELEQPGDLMKCGSDSGALGAYRSGLAVPQGGGSAAPPHPALSSLASQVTAPGLPADFLAGIWAAPDLDTALEARARLETGHSVITTDGTWLGRDWVRVGQPREAGTLDRAAELKSISSSYQQTQQHCDQLQQELATKRELQHQGDIELQRTREQLQDLQDRLAQRQGEVAVGETRIADRQKRSDELSRVISENSEQQNQLHREIDELNAAIRLSHDKIEAAQGNIARCQEDCERARDKLERERAAQDEAREATHQAALSHEAANTRLESLRASLQRQEQNHRREQARAAELATELDQVRQVIPEQQQKLQELLARRKSSERQLQEKQLQLQQLREDASSREKQHKEMQDALEQRQNSIQENKIKIAELETQQRMVSEQIDAAGHSPRQLVATVEADASLEKLQQELATVQRRLGNLGQVNLAAIDEQRELEQRGQYLQQQRQDLEQALNTLQNAIRRIDIESRKRFTETFNQVNVNLKETFTMLFGGGVAQLELLQQEGDTDPGVVIRARPPGKRGGLINILSGGEKTLVSLALVFSIFMLNPSPVCFLDEVDAPLDDANIGRFINMVRAMSEQLQFVFITHNKLSMEMADVLLGVTMREAGVSRLVSVDAQEAVSLASSGADQAQVAS